MADKSYQVLEHLNRSRELLAKEVEGNPLEHLIEGLENIVEGQIQQIDGLPTEETVKLLEKELTGIEALKPNSDDWRRAIQLAYFQVAKEMALIANHAPTPEGVNALVSLLVKELMKDAKEPLHVTDLALGGGFLLSAVLQSLSESHSVRGDGVEVDELLAALAENVREILDVPLQVHLQDSLEHLLLDPASLAISDLPVGYYPKQEVAERYAMKREEGMSYAHELLIEQSFNYLAESGWGCFLLPMNQLDLEAIQHLMKFLKGKGYLQAVLSLPATFFKNERQQKGLVFIQKAGDKAKQASPALMGQIPDFSNKEALEDFLNTFHHWRQSVL